MYLFDCPHSFLHFDIFQSAWIWSHLHVGPDLIFEGGYFVPILNQMPQHIHFL